MRYTRLFGWRTLCLSFSVFTLLAFEAHSRIIPSFRADFSIQKATHVVVASEGETIDGVVEVVECWKGDLDAGDIIEVPELEQFASRESRAIENWRGAERGVVSEKRMILFLVKSFDWGDGKTDKQKTRWLPSSYPDYMPIGAGGPWALDSNERMRISVAWIENGESYVFSQMMNPGPLVLSSGPSEDEIRKCLEDFLKNQNALNAINVVSDPVERVNRAIAYGREHPEYVHDAIMIVAGADEAALPGLRRMLNDDSSANVRSALLCYLAQVGGVAAGPEVTEALKTELAFWRETAPTLQKGWWNDRTTGADRRQTLRSRYSLAIEVLRTLGGLGYEGCRDTIIEFRDYWQTLPPMSDDGGSTQMAETCDEILKSLGRPPSMRFNTVWGFDLAAGVPDPVKRAEALRSFLESGGSRYDERVYNALAECGVPALPYLRSVLQDESRLEEHALAIHYLAKAGGIRVGEEIAQLLPGELEYWRQNDAPLRNGIDWNNLPSETARRIGKLEAALKALEGIEFPGAVDQVRAILEYWKELPTPWSLEWQTIMRTSTSYLSEYSTK